MTKRALTEHDFREMAFFANTLRDLQAFQGGGGALKIQGGDEILSDDFRKEFKDLHNAIEAKCVKGLSELCRQFLDSIEGAEQ